jgi:nicotinate-nucleotide adenylyltransferase
MRLGIFGGTFDPLHIGHLILAADAHSQFKLDRILWVLTPDPPHKQDRCISGLEERLEMLTATLADNPAFVISTVDIDRPPPQHSVDTVHLLRKANPGATLMFLMGGDSLSDLPKWYRAQEFVDACDEIGGMLRPGYEVDWSELEPALHGLREKTRFTHAPLLEISSSEVRRRIAEGLHYRYYLPDPVYRIIAAKSFYEDAC